MIHESHLTDALTLLNVKTNSFIGNVINATRGTYHDTSQKHLSHYLGEISFRFNHRFRLELMVPALINLATRSKLIPQRQLRLAEESS